MLRPYFALLLLLCLLRTLLPEAWVLALHAHEHTREEVVARQPARGKALLSKQHTHCQAEQFYDVPFQAGPPVAVPQPRLGRRYQALAGRATLACLATGRLGPALRGPPVG